MWYCRFTILFKDIFYPLLFLLAAAPCVHISAKSALLLNSAIMESGEEVVLERILNYYATVPQECIYIQTDKDYYAAGDTVWFRAHLVDAATCVPVSRSQFVYVELHDQKTDTLMQRIMVKADDDGVFANVLPLPKQMKSGVYTLAAYTQWMRNFPVERFCYRPLTIVGHEMLSLPLTQHSLGEEKRKGNDGSPLLVGQRKGRLMIQLNDDRTDTLSCILYGSGNLIELTYIPRKVISIDSKELHPGMVTIALVERQANTVIAGQDIYIEESNDAVFNAYGKVPAAKSMMKVTIGLKDKSGLPLKGDYAVSVVDADVIHPNTYVPNICQTLLCHDNNYSLHDMLQGHYPDITYPIQTQQLITGRIKDAWGRRIKQPRLLLLNTRTGHRQEFELGDSTRFALAVDNPNGTTFQLEGIRGSGRTSFVEIQVDSLSFPKLLIPQYEMMNDSSITAFVTQAQLQQMYSRAEYIELPEVEKVGKKPQVQRRNMFFQEAPKGFKEDDPQIEHAINIKSLLYRLGIRIGIDDSSGDEFLYNVNTFVDNVAVDDMDFVLKNLPPTDVSSIEYFPPNNPRNVIFGIRPDRMGNVPGVLFIFLKDGSEIVHSKGNRPLSMATVRQLGYEPPVEFYSPQYPAADKSQYTRPDYRTTLYWNPKVRIDETGEATVTFYASDVSKRYLVTIEGGSDDGIVVSKQVVIE